MDKEKRASFSEMCGTDENFDEKKFIKDKNLVLKLKKAIE